MLATLYGVSISAINQHIKNVKVDNERAVQFRKWANQIVKDFTIKGWVMDDERLKNGGSILTEKYFEESLERIREIRMSEKNFIKKLQTFMRLQ